MVEVTKNLGQYVALYCNEKVLALKEKIAQRNNQALDAEIKANTFPEPTKEEAIAIEKKQLAVNEQIILSNLCKNYDEVVKYNRLVQQDRDKRKRLKEKKQYIYQLTTHYPNGEPKIKYMSYDKCHDRYTVQTTLNGKLMKVGSSKDYETAKALALEYAASREA